MAGKGQEHKPHLVNLGLPENTMQRNVTNKPSSGKKHAPDVPVHKGKNRDDKKEEKLMKAGIESRRKKIECLAKSGFFATDIPKSVEVEIFDELIELKGPYPTAVKTAKEKVKQRIQDIKSKSLNITSNQSKILTMNSTYNFIDYHLNIPKLLVTWEVLAVVDQGKMNVFSFDEKEAEEMSGKIMACIAEETVSRNDSELPWFKDFCEKEKSRIIIESAKKGKIKVYMTADLRKIYFDVKRPPRSPQNIAACGSPLQNGASGEQKDPSTNQETEAGASNNPQSPRNKGSNKHVELEKDGKAEASTTNSKYKVSFDKFEDKATFRFKMKIQSTEIEKVKKAVEKLKKDISEITLDEDSNQVVCDATQSQISHIKKELAMYEDLSLSYDMIEDDYNALIYITNDDEWRSHVKKYKYVKGKAIFDVEDSDAVSMVATCIKSKLEWLMQLAGTEVIPPSNHSTPLTDLISEVEDTWPGMYCFLSFDRKRIIIKASSKEQAQQAKYIIEANLGMVQGGGRRNRKFASPDEVGPGPVFSPPITSDLTMRERMTFKTKEGITTEKDTERNSAQVVKTSGILPPSHWFNMGNENFLKIAIKPGEDSCQKYEWENIQTKFESTLPQARIVSIQRIQNIFMWEHFYLKKRQFEHAYGKGCSNQLSLFHGTTPDMLDVIAEQNLDPRLAGDLMGARLGQGTYFAVSPEYSDLYAQSDSQGHKFMFFANVLAGKSCIGKTDYKRPPMNPDMKPRLFDSCVDNVQNPKVYCIFHDTQYYLKYLIEYT